MRVMCTIVLVELVLRSGFCWPWCFVNQGSGFEDVSLQGFALIRGFWLLGVWTVWILFSGVR